MLAYIARYTHRVAIVNHRLLRLTGEQVTFTYKDYTQGGRVREMTLPIEELIRRFYYTCFPIASSVSAITVFGPTDIERATWRGAASCSVAPRRRKLRLRIRRSARTGKHGWLG